MRKRTCRNDGAELRVFWDEPMGTAWQCVKCLVVTNQDQLDDDATNVLREQGGRNDL